MPLPRWRSVARKRRRVSNRYLGRISTAELVAPESTRADDDPGVVGLLATRRRVPVAIVGLVGIVITFVGITAMFAFQQAPFYDSDEKAHLGYAHEIADFRLPEIERQPAVPDSATQWQVERGTGQDSRYRSVWVANHPPLHYVAVAPLIWFAEATERPDGGLLLMRFANIAFAAAGVVFTYLLATELAGKRHVGLAAAAIVALVPQGHTYFSRALNDGLAFAAGTALLWAGVRCLRRPDRRNLLVLGAAAAVASGTRTATMLLAVVVVAAVAFDQLVRSRSEAWRPRVRVAATVVAIGLGPAAVVFGWFYVRIQLLYGDVGASTFLLNHFDREPRGSIPFVLTQGRLWVDLFHRMASTAPLSWAWPRFANIVGLVAIVGLVVALARPRAGYEQEGHRRLPRRRGDHHSDSRPASRRRRQRLLALLLSSARRARCPCRRRVRSPLAPSAPGSGRRGDGLVGDQTDAHWCRPGVHSPPSRQRRSATSGPARAYRSATAGACSLPG